VHFILVQMAALDRVDYLRHVILELQLRRVKFLLLRQGKIGLGLIFFQGPSVRLFIAAQYFGQSREN